MFFDFHVHGNGKLVREAERLGYVGIALVNWDEYHTNPTRNDQNTNHGKNKGTDLGNNQITNPPGNNQITNLWENQNNSPELDMAGEHSPIQILKGVEIYSKNPQDLKRKLQKFRKKADVLLVHGGDLKINRAACENPRVDLLSHPYYSRRDSGINHVLARKAAENGVAIEFNLKYLFKNRFSHRYRVLSQFRDILKLQRKFKFPLIITSGANSIYDLRSPLDVISLTRCFGMSKEEAYHALSETPKEIIESNRLRDRLIAEGIILVE